jgi:hypothetical protein
MLRRLFTVLSALSLLLCVAAVVLWVRSHRTVDLLQRQYVDTSGRHTVLHQDSLSKENGKLAVE